MQILKADGLVFECEDDVEVTRVQTMQTKEEGTIRWLEGLREDDVFYDIGANIGLYSLLGARKCRQVVAIEPNIATARSLLRNVAANGMGERIKVLTCALHSEPTFLAFNYNSLAPGWSGSQLGHTTGEAGEFEAVATEWKYATKVDKLWQDLNLKPTVVKLDVDGNEMAILRGMYWLIDAQAIRSLQVEVHPKDKAEIDAFLAGFGYEHRLRHDTANGLRRIAKGIDPATVVHNAVYEVAA